MGDRHQAAILFNTAVQALNDTSNNNPNKSTHAYQLFASACFTDPTWFEALFQAGNNSSDLNWPEAATACYHRALECNMTDEEKGKAYTNLGWKLHQLGRTKEGLKYSLEAIKYVPRMPYAYVNLSCIYQILCDPETSLQYAQKGFELAPDDATTATQHAFALLFARRMASGLKAFESRFEYELKNFTQFPFPKWEGEEGKTVYLISDQGLGDCLDYARFLRQACKRCKFVHAFIHPELMRAFNNTFVDIENLSLSPTATPYPSAEYWTTFVSLPFALGLTDEEILNAPPVEIPVFSMPVNWRIPDRKFHIGIAWAGSPLNKIDACRNIPVKMFAELYRVPGIQLYSLQVGPRNMDMHENGFVPVIRDMVPYICDITDTVAILQHLDLVICCESAMGHICAAAGKECWMPYSYMGLDYRVGVDGSTAIWTPKHRFFKMREHNNWQPVFEEIIKALPERIAQKEEEKAKGLK